MSLTANSIPTTADESNSARVVESTIRKCNQLATLPAVVVDIIRLSEDPDSTLEDLAKVIVGDPVLGVRILKLMNSPYYGMPGRINSIHRAILQLGFKAVKNIAIAASLTKLIRGGHVSPDFDAGDLWAHSIAVATGAQMLARQSDLVPAEEAFLAGLIHDMGIVVEMQACGPAFAQMIQTLAADKKLTFRNAEAEVLGASHENFGAGLCRAWNFPASLQFVAGYHHRPWALAAAQRRLPTLVHIADVLAARIGLGYTRTVETDSVAPSLLGCVNLTQADLDAVAERLPEAVQQSQGLLSDGR